MNIPKHIVFMNAILLFISGVWMIYFALYTHSKQTDLQYEVNQCQEALSLVGSSLDSHLGDGQ